MRWDPWRVSGHAGLGRCKLQTPAHSDGLSDRPGFGSITLRFHLTWFCQEYFLHQTPWFLCSRMLYTSRENGLLGGFDESRCDIIAELLEALEDNPSECSYGKPKLESLPVLQEMCLAIVQYLLNVPTVTLCGLSTFSA